MNLISMKKLVWLYTYLGKQYTGFIKWALVSFQIVLLLCINSSNLLAQDPCFTVDVSLGCDTLAVNVLDCSGGAVHYIFEYDSTANPPQTPVSSTSHIYTVKDTSLVCQNYSIFQIVGGAQPKTLVQYDIVRVCKPVAPNLMIWACENNQIQVVAKDTVYSSIQIDFGDGTIQSIQPNETLIHQYAATGNYSISAFGLFSGSACGSLHTDINAATTIPPAALDSAINDQNGNITLYYQLPDHVNYVLEEKVGSGNYQKIDTLDANLTNISLTGKSITENYTYRISAINPCSATEIFSEELPILPASVSAQMEANRVFWESYSPFGLSSYQVLRNQALLASPTTSDLEYQDEQILCGQAYQYHLRTVLNSGQVIITDLGTVTAIGTNQPIEADFFITSVIDQQITALWNISSSDSTRLTLYYGTDSEGSFSDSSSVSSSQWAHPSADPTTDTLCFQLKIEDQCGNVSTSAISCNLHLNVVKQGLDNFLTWHEYTGLGNNYEFVIELLNSDGSVHDSYPALSSSTVDYLDIGPFDTEQIKRYRLKAVSTDGSDITAYSNIVEVVEVLEIIVPDAFTPNGDGLNDYLEVHGNFIATIQIDIYNRWGLKLFTSETITDLWDGTHEGRKMPQGVYTYIIQGTDSFGNPYEQKGTVLLLRN